MKQARLVLGALAVAGLLVACAAAKSAPGASPEGAESVEGAASASPGAPEGTSTPSVPGPIYVPGPAGPGPRSAQGTSPSHGDAGAGRTTAPGDAPSAPAIASLLEGLRWGMTKDEVVKVHTSVGGVLWKEYDAILAKARVGPEMTAVERERDSAMRAFERTWIEFEGTPTGYDATGLRPEYSYRNKEAVLTLRRPNKARYFFFINNRLWKVYEELTLGEGQPVGKTFADAVNTMNSKFGSPGRILAPEPAAGRPNTTVDWRDHSSHARLVDRSAERKVALVSEDLATLNNLSSLRVNKDANLMEVDPTVAAVTTGANRSDPNAAVPTAGSAPDPKKPPPKKKK